MTPTDTILHALDCCADNAWCSGVPDARLEAYSVHTITGIILSTDCIASSGYFSDDDGEDCQHSADELVAVLTVAVLQWLSAALDDSLGRWTKAELDAHLDDCAQ